MSTMNEPAFNRRKMLKKEKTPEEVQKENYFKELENEFKKINDTQFVQTNGNAKQFVETIKEIIELIMKLRKEVAESTTKIETHTSDLETVKLELEGKRTELEALKEEQIREAQELKDAELRYRSLENEKNNLQAQLTESSNVSETAKAELTGKISEINSQLEGVKKLVEKEKADKVKVDGELKVAQDEINRLESAGKDISSQLELAKESSNQCSGFIGQLNNILKKVVHPEAPTGGKRRRSKKNKTKKRKTKTRSKKQTRRKSRNNVRTNRRRR